MLKLDEIKSFYPEFLHKFPRFMVREYLQYKILDIIYGSKHANFLSFMGGTCLRIIHVFALYTAIRLRLKMRLKRHVTILIWKLWQKTLSRFSLIQKTRKEFYFLKNIFNQSFQISIFKFHFFLYSLSIFSVAYWTISLPH